jgi:hydrogenase maturation factor HypF (carbamoyltransferase family)
LGGTIACAPKEYKPFIPPKVEFEKTEKYVLDLAFTRDEFKKIMALSAGYNSQQVLLKDHEALVNTYIAEINALKELVALREQIIEQYIQLYAMSENAYRQERYEHKWDNAENKIVQVLMMAGLVLLML